MEHFFMELPSDKLSRILFLQQLIFLEEFRIPKVPLATGEDCKEARRQRNLVSSVIADSLLGLDLWIHFQFC
jgi:hypothetical protein